MATAPVRNSGWVDYAMLQSSSDPTKQWLVQRHEDTLDFRCRCPAFIFSGKGGKKRMCKHIRAVLADLQGTPQPAVAALGRPVYWDQAAAMVTDMIAAAKATSLVTKTKAVSLEQVAIDAMIRHLAKQLAGFVPPPLTKAAPAQTVGGGLRLITFVDD